ncbi:MAG: carboxylesterase family protein [Bacteroidales bacterium]|jgi:para-nitrobenzyl esterase|nr:carboxylesterase family protein [Bacteroidales bacterium]MCI1786001.1 carboxylesterase family protein [Bacteroidales bacterium]
MNRNLRFFFMVFFFMLLLVSCAGEHNPVLTITGGRVRGVLNDSAGVLIYKGIPYAAPPVGNLRWEKPCAVNGWDTVMIADKFGPAEWQSPQPPGSFYKKEFYWNGEPAMSEDCLYLNVWAPAKTVGNTKAGLPVAMWIHGGAFNHGYGYEITMDGTSWAERGVILVTINYRLGIFGFMAHPALSGIQGGSSGNYGLLDQIAAIKWIKDNIATFGGNPDDITIFGQSAGAMSVKDLCVSPLSRTLMSKAIIQSGGGISDNDIPVTQSECDSLGKAIMDSAGLNTLALMRNASPETLMAALDSFIKKKHTFIMQCPHIDGNVLTETFSSAVKNGDIADIPYMIGYNSDDIPSLSGSVVDNFCRTRYEKGGKPVYEYYFSRNLPGDDGDPKTDPGAFHSAELWYMFNTLSRSWRPFTAADYELASGMTDCWTEFAKSGNPGGIAGTEWKQYGKNGFVYTFNIK